MSDNTKEVLNNLMYWLFLLAICGMFLLSGCAASRPVATSPAPVLSVIEAHENEAESTNPLDFDSARTKRPQWLSPFARLAPGAAFAGGSNFVADHQVGEIAPAPVVKKNTPTKEPEKKTAPAPRKGLFSFLGGTAAENKKDQSSRTKIKNSTIILQQGDANSSEQSTTGKQKSSGSSALTTGDGSSASGGKVEPRRAGALPWWAWLLGGMALGVYLRPQFARFFRWVPFFALLFFLLPATPGVAQRQLSVPRTRYSYKEARQVERGIEQARRANRREDKRAFRRLRREHRERELFFRQWHKRPPLAKRS